MCLPPSLDLRRVWWMWATWYRMLLQSVVGGYVRKRAGLGENVERASGRAKGILSIARVGAVFRHWDVVGRENPAGRLQ